MASAIGLHNYMYRQPQQTELVNLANDTYETVCRYASRVKQMKATRAYDR